MFRRRTASPPATEVDHLAATEPHPPSPLLAELEAAGWLLPRGVRGGASGPPRWSLVGTVASPVATPVDPAGLVVGEGWSLDWWVGADDRWRLPAHEPSVRQSLLLDAPVVETVVRIPGGDVAHRAYGVRSPRPVGDEWVVVEIENRTSVPFASVLVVRPLLADGVGAVGEITLEPVDGGRGRDQAHLVRVDGRPAVVLPRRPARMAVGSREAGDLVRAVTSGEAGADLVSARCPAGLATAAFVFPTPHAAVLRVAIPVGPVGSDPVAYPQVLPDAHTVASGWEIHRRGPRIEVPDHHLAGAVERARAHVQLAHDGEAVRRDGHRAPDLELGATEVLLEAFDVLDRPVETGVVVARWLDRLAVATPEHDALVLAAVSRHWLLHRVDELLDWMLPEVAAAVERLGRADRKGLLADPVVRWRTAEAVSRAARMLDRAGQPDAAEAVLDLERRLRAGARSPVVALDTADHDTAGDATSPGGRGPGEQADTGVAVVDRLLAATGPALEALVAEGGPTSTWPGPGPDRRRIGHDLAASAALVVAARRRLVEEHVNGLDLLPYHPDGWYGGGIEVHDLPTEWGRLSYAVRWHGIRPALLWHLEPHPGVGPVRIAVPSLDPTWSTTEVRGDALLGEVVPPGGLQSLTIMAEHPDIDPAMRRPAPDPPSAPPASPPDGGSFS
jgi:hypothetical protein